MLRTDPQTLHPVAAMPEPTPDALRRSFLEGMRRVAHTVTVVATDGPAGRAGATVSAMTSVSVEGEHPTLLVCLNAASHCAAAVIENGLFAVNVLGTDGVELSNTFAGRHVQGDDKFAGIAWHRGVIGAPILDNCVVAFECRIQSRQLVGSHHVIIGEVAAMHLSEPAETLVYENRAYGRFQPLS